jgi:hypothetical protein
MRVLLTAQAVDWTGGLDDAWTSIAAFVPKLLVFLVILLIGWLVAKAVSKGLELLMDKLGFGRLLARAGIDRWTGDSQIDVGTVIVKLVYYFILLIALQLALSAFGDQNPVSQIVNDIVAWLPRAFVAIVIIVAAAVANAVKDVMGAALSGLSYGRLLTRIVGIFIIALGVIAALNQVGIGLSVTLPVLIAVLATVGGILVVGVGGGLIGPMRQRWEGWLGQLESDTRSFRQSSGPADPTYTSSGYGGAGTQATPYGDPSPTPESTPRLQDPGSTTQRF